MLSTDIEKKEIEQVLTAYLKLPFSADNVPGSIMEYIFADIRGDEVLKTYDFVDVINRENKTGWQVKSTKHDTPVTWMRAKIPGSADLIIDSLKSEQALQFLGDTIIDYCNAHILKSFDKYKLQEIGYSRLILLKDNRIQYFEKILCTREHPILFHKSDFKWGWSNKKDNSKKGSKEQLSSLQGFHRLSGNKWFSWHGLGENQLHFNGEKYWWPKDKLTIFDFPKDKITLRDLIKFINS